MTCRCRGCAAFQAHHVNCQIIEVLLLQWERWYAGAWKNGLRIAEVPQVPLPIRPLIGHIGGDRSRPCPLRRGSDDRRHTGVGQRGFGPGPPMDQPSAWRISSVTKCRVGRRHKSGKTHQPQGHGTLCIDNPSRRRNGRTGLREEKRAASYKDSHRGVLRGQSVRHHRDSQRVQTLDKLSARTRPLCS